MNNPVNDLRYAYYGRYSVQQRFTGIGINSFPATAWSPGNPGSPYASDFGSFHEGGAFFCFTDGAVRFLSENIDQGTFAALGTRANNEIVDDEDY